MASINSEMDYKEGKGYTVNFFVSYVNVHCMSCSELHWLCWGELECRGNVVWSEKCFQKLGACLIYPCASSHTELPAACGSNKMTCPRQFHTNTPFGPSFFLALVPILLKTVPLWFLILELWGLQLILLLETYQFAYLVLYLIGKSVLLDLKPFHSVGPNRTLCKRRIKLYGTHSIWTCMNSTLHWKPMKRPNAINIDKTCGFWR